MTMRRLRLIEGGAGKAPRQGGDSVAGKAPLQGGTMKVAIASQDLKTVDAHFGGARNIMLFDVSETGHRLIEAIRFDQATDQKGGHDEGDHGGVDERVAAIRGCALLFVRAIGGPAAAKVVNSRVHPIKLVRDEPIDDVLERVRAMLDSAPPPWLRKLVERERRAGSELEEEPA